MLKIYQFTGQFSRPFASIADMVCTLLLSQPFFNVGRSKIILNCFCLSGELLHSEPSAYQGCRARQPEGASLRAAAMSCHTKSAAQ